MHRTEQFDIIQKLQHFKDIQDLSASGENRLFKTISIFALRFQID